jgi:hypothetical protein
MKNTDKRIIPSTTYYTTTISLSEDQAKAPHSDRNTPPPPPPGQNQKWATFTYTRKKTTHITNLFKHTNIRVAFRTNNNLLTHLTNRVHTHGEK